MALFLEENELPDAYKDASAAAREWFRPFDEFERIANNLPSPTLPESYPQVTDGTLAALVAETPMRVWAQLQTGRAVPLDLGDENYEAWKTEMVNILWANRIVPNANTQAPFFSKLQTAEYRSLIYGSQPMFAFQVSRDGYTGSDFVLPYIKDVKLEPGKVADRDCDYEFLDTYYTKLQLKNLIKQAEDDKEGLSGWNVDILKEAYDSNIFKDKETDDQNSSEQGKQNYSKRAKFVTVLHRGYEAPYYTFIPALSNKIARVTLNRNRSGDLPITFIYNQQDLINPYGRGQIELAGPTQNMLDFLLAAFGLGTQQGLEPALKVSGQNLETSGIEWDTLHFAPGNPMVVGTAEVDVMKSTTSVYDSFASNSGIFKTQIMNLQGSSDASVSSTSGNPQYSKTPAGVKYQQERTNAKDNFLRQRADEAVSALAKNLINLAIGNMSGGEFVKITEDQREKLISAGKDVPADATQILVEFDELKDGEFNFDVDPNSSIVKNDDDTKERLVELTTTLLGIPELPAYLQADGKELHVGELISRILSTAGIDDWEKVITDISPEKLAAIQAAENAAATGMEVPAEELPVDQPIEQPMEQVPMEDMQMQPEQEMPQDAQIEPTNARDQIAIGLLQEGWEQDDVIVYLMLMQNGWEDPQIREYIAKEQAAMQGVEA